MTQPGIAMRFLPLALLLFCACSAADERPLRFSVIESWAMPLIKVDNGEAVGGIVYDLQMRLAQKVGRRAEMLVLPRKRVQAMLVRGEIDVRCYVNPNWMTESHHQYIWSVPFMTQRDLLVARTPRTVTLEQLHGELVGTVLGYVYPQLQPKFDSHDLQRDDARTQELALLKLDAGRNNYAVSSELTLNWFNRDQPPHHKLQPLLELSSDLASCIVRDEPDVPTMALLRAMVQMSNDGEFEKILARYR